MTAASVDSGRISFCDALILGLAGGTGASLEKNADGIQLLSETVKRFLYRLSKTTKSVNSQKRFLIQTLRFFLSHIRLWVPGTEPKVTHICCWHQIIGVGLFRHHFFRCAPSVRRFSLSAFIFCCVVPSARQFPSFSLWCACSMPIFHVCGLGDSLVPARGYRVQTRFILNRVQPG